MKDAKAGYFSRICYFFMKDILYFIKIKGRGLQGNSGVAAYPLLQYYANGCEGGLHYSLSHNGIPISEVSGICSGLDELLRDIRVLPSHP